MVKLVVTILFLLSIDFAYSQIFCPFPFVSSANGQNFKNCYYYAGVANDHVSAKYQCAARSAFLVTAKDQSVLSDLYPLYKAFTNFYFWVGANASSYNPYDFRWQDGSPVNPSAWCSGHPKGGKNLCAFYTTTAVIGRDSCIKTGECSGTFFDHGAICQYGANFGK